VILWMPAAARRSWAPLLLALALLALSWRALQRHSGQSELKRQAQADFALLRTLAEKKNEG